MSTAATGRVAAIIPAAGSGVCLGADVPKAFLALGGLSLLTRSALAMSTVADVLIIAAPADSLDEASAQLAQVDAEIHIVAGGEHRQESVANALRMVPEDVSIVLVHAAARVAPAPTHGGTAQPEQPALTLVVIDREGLRTLGVSA